MPTVASQVAALMTAAVAADTTQLYAAHQSRELASLGGSGQPLATASVTKVIVGASLGRAEFLGLLAIDDPVHRWFPEWSNGPKAEITVRHVMGHVSGLAADTWPQLDSSPPRDLLSHVLNELPVVARPSEVMAYNNAAVMLLPAIVSRVAQMPYFDFIRSELFGPLGIENWHWRCDEAGNPLGMAAAALNAADLARVGQLLLHNGQWGDRQLLDPTWVTTCRRGPAEPRKLGLLLMNWWAGSKPGAEPIAFGHDGSGGQHLWVYPDAELIVARLRDNRTPDGNGFSPGTPEQAFLELPNLGAAVATALPGRMSTH